VKSGLRSRLLSLEKSQAREELANRRFPIYVVPVPGDGLPAFATISGYGQINREDGETGSQFKQRVNKAVKGVL